MATKFELTNAITRIYNECICSGCGGKGFTFLNTGGQPDPDDPVEECEECNGSGLLGAADWGDIEKMRAAINEARELIDSPHQRNVDVDNTLLSLENNLTRLKKLLG